MAQRDFAMDELLRAQEAIKRSKEKEYRERRKHEKASLSGLSALAKELQVGALFQSAYAGFYRRFGGAIPVRETLAFRSRMENRWVTILRFPLNLSSRDKGLCFEIYLNRLFLVLPENDAEKQQSLASLFPLTGDRQAPSSGWARGYFTRKAQIAHAAEALQEYGYERAMEKARDAQARAVPTIWPGQWDRDIGPV
jgi:hypothetical protein